MIETLVLSHQPAIQPFRRFLDGDRRVAERFALQHREIARYLFHGIHEVRGSIPLISTT